jgi:hypothetical protein
VRMVEPATRARTPTHYHYNTRARPSHQCKHGGHDREGQLLQEQEERVQVNRLVAVCGSLCFLSLWPSTAYRTEHTLTLPRNEPLVLIGGGRTDPMPFSHDPAHYSLPFHPRTPRNSSGDTLSARSLDERRVYEALPSRWFAPRLPWRLPRRRPVQNPAQARFR